MRDLCIVDAEWLYEAAPDYFRRKLRTARSWTPTPQELPVWLRPGAWPQLFLQQTPSSAARGAVSFSATEYADFQQQRAPLLNLLRLNHVDVYISFKPWALQNYAFDSC
jgi:hypothetical protein